MKKQYETNADRQAAYRARQKAKTAAMEAELARARAEKAPPRDWRQARTPEDWEALRRETTEANKAKRAAAKRLRAEALAAEPETPDTSREALLVENEALKKQLKGTRTQIANLKKEVDLMLGRTKGIAMTKRLNREILFCLHPDRSVSEGRLTKCFQAFSALKIKLFDD
jgi:hypothetical protein